MSNSHLFFRFTRLWDYVHILVLLFPVIFLISPESLFTYKALVVFVANLCLTAYGYMYNDLEDAVDDYHDLEKRKRNPVASGEITRGQSYAANLALLGVGLALLAYVGVFALALGVVFAVVGFLYSWRPLRLKSTPVWDVVSHVLFLGVQQLLITYVAFRPLDWLVVPFLMIIVPFSLMNEIMHELLDFDVDKVTEVSNTVQRYGGFNVRGLLVILSLLVVGGAAIIVYSLSAEYRVVGLGISLVVVGPAIYQMNGRVARITRAG
jgi:4-hydroxybenzoate polyprenyltransferase